MEDENVASNPSSPQGRTELVDEIIDIVEAVKDIGEYRRTQRKECDNLIRRLKVFLPLLDEIRDLSSPIPEAGIECLKKLKKAFQSAKSLLHMCHSGSKIYLATESEAMMVRFHSVYEKINQAVEGMPYEKLGISEAAKEQIELLSVQMKRAKKRTDTQDMELAMDLMVALSTNDDRNADSATIERLANKLGLHTAEELGIETQAIKKIKETRCGPRVENMQLIINLLNKFKRLAGVPEDDLDENDSQVPKPLVKTLSATIPNEFLCPITLEIMKDPVIIVTGQTYERKSIEQWFDAGHKTCPKTGQSLSNLSIAPNFALKNLILQWCEKNNFEVQQETDQTEEGPSTSDDNGSISAWVQNLSSSKLDEQRAAVKKIRLLSKENPENRVLIAKSGGIPPLVHLLSYPDSRIQEHAVTALLNLSIDESNKKLISREEPIPAIIEVLQKGSVGAKENSAAALFSLSMLDENKEKIGQLNGIPPLIELLKTGTIRGKKDAVTALFNLCLNHANKIRAIDAGIVSPLLKVVEDRKLDLVDETLSILLILASNPKGKQELGKLSFIDTLVNFMKDGTPKNKECAASVLLELGSNNTNLILAALQYGVYAHLVEISQNCTERGQRKAKSILQLMSMAEQIP